MKLEVGMYVRTLKGIAKIIGQNDDVRYYYPNAYVTDTYLNINDDTEYLYEDDILKASRNIIDLIEVGDYVNGHLVTATYNPNGDEMYHISLQNGKDYILIHNDDEIKSILTHEQYEANCYKVAE